MRSIVDIYIVACCLVTGIGLIILGIHVIRTKWQMLKFKNIEGTITNMGTTEVYEMGGVDDFLDSGIRNRPTISWKFILDNKQYRGHSADGRVVHPSREEKKKGKISLYCGKKKVGDPINVYYNPDKPEENSLYKYPIPFSGIVSIIAGLSFIVLTIYLFNKWYTQG